VEMTDKRCPLIAPQKRGAAEGHTAEGIQATNPYRHL
jgi:hypothetical protein